MVKGYGWDGPNAEKFPVFAVAINVTILDPNFAWGKSIRMDRSLPILIIGNFMQCVKYGYHVVVPPSVSFAHFVTFCGHPMISPIVFFEKFPAT